MKHHMIAGAAAALAVGSVVLAAPANADLTPGTYSYRSVMANGMVTDTMMRVQSCGPGCVSLFNLYDNTDQGQARVQGTRYVLDKFVPAGAFCPDGRPVDVMTRYSFDLDGRNGIYTLAGPNPCGTPGPVGETAFTLTPA